MNDDQNQPRDKSPLLLQAAVLKGPLGRLICKGTTVRESKEIGKCMFEIDLKHTLVSFTMSNATCRFAVCTGSEIVYIKPATAKHDDSS